MKIAVLGDTHFGARNDNSAFHDYIERFYVNVFFPYLKDNKIKHIIQLGDLFDRRKYVNFFTLKRSRDYFFDPIATNDLRMSVFVGNHDTYYKNTNEVNSPELLLQEYSKYVHIYSEPTDLYLDGEDSPVALLPWVCSGNYADSMNYVQNTKAQVLLGHLELAGFEMYRGITNDHGMDAKLFDKFDVVMSGHFHHKSSKGNVHYLGTPYEMTWSDYNDPKGFHIFDTDTRSLTFVENPYKLFRKWFYDDTKWEGPEHLDTLNFDEVKDTFVKVVVKNKNNPYWFDLYIDRLEKAGVIDLQVVDDHLHLDLEDDGDITNDAEDTLTILRKVIDGIEHNTVPKKELDLFLTTLYNEALYVE